ncbi:MAG: amino acid ABC transporter permease [Geminicoccaceae bacterium]
MRLSSSRSLARSPIVQVLLYASFVGAVIWFTYEGAVATGYRWDWHRVPGYLLEIRDGTAVPGRLIDGLMVTLKITFWSFLLMVVFGLSAALLGRSPSLIGRWLARAYVELIRNTPLLVQLYVAYFVLAPIFGIDRTVCAVLTLAAFEGAYAAEIFRAGLDGVAKGQWEASSSLGLGTVDSYRFVLLPQAVRSILPPLTGQTVSLIKDSSIVSVIAVYDLTTEARDAIADSFLTFEIWLTVAAIYLVMTVSLSLAVTSLERRLARAYG